MTSPESYTPDRFGCGRIAWAIFWALTLGFIVIGWLWANPDAFNALRQAMTGHEERPGGEGPILVSDRYYSVGHANASVSGAFHSRTRFRSTRLLATSRRGFHGSRSATVAQPRC